MAPDVLPTFAAELLDNQSVGVLVEDMNRLDIGAINATENDGHRPQTGKIESHRIGDNNSNVVPYHPGKRLIHNQTISNNDRKSQQQLEEKQSNDLASH